MKILTNRLEKKGFAMISVVSVVILMALVAIGLLTMASLNTRTQGLANDREQAKSNAKLALMDAINELQKTAGVDSSITFSADILLDDINSTSNFPPTLLGVNASWMGDNHDRATGKPIVPNYEAKTRLFDPDDPQRGKFKGWMISGADDLGADSPPDLTFAPDKVPLLTANTFERARNVFSEEELANLEIHVNPEVILDSRGNLVGGTAWWIRGNNMSALLRFDENEPETDLEWSQRLAAYSYSDATHFGFEDTEVLNRMPTQNTTKLLDGYTIDDYNYLGTTVISQGLLTNAATGGLKRDFSIFSEKWNNPNSLNGGAWGAELNASDINVFGLTLEDKHETELALSGDGYLYPWVVGTPGASTGHYASMSWASLANYIGLYKQVEARQGSGVTFPVFSFTEYQDEDFHSPDLYNIIEPSLYSSSWIWGYASLELAATAAGAEPEYRPASSLKPILVYFNPYNVSIDGNQFRSERLVFSNDTGTVNISGNTFSDGITVPFEIAMNLPRNKGGVPRDFFFDSSRMFGVANSSASTGGEGGQLSASFEVNPNVTFPVNDIDFLWKPGESKVLGDVSRFIAHQGTVGTEDESGILGLSSRLNPVNRTHSGYNTDEAVVFLLDTVNGRSDGLIGYGVNRRLEGTDTLTAGLEIHRDLGGTNDISLYATRDATLYGPYNSNINSVALKKVFTTVYDPAVENFGETLPLIQSDGTLIDISQGNVKLAGTAIEDVALQQGVPSSIGNLSPYLQATYGYRNLAGYNPNTRTKGNLNHKHVLPPYFHRDNLVDTSSHHSPFEWRLFDLSGGNITFLFNDAGNVSNDADVGSPIGASFDPNLAGVYRWPVTELPTQPLLSIGQLQHFDPAFLNYHYPYVSNAFGNSHAVPYIRPTELEVTNNSENTDGFDHSFAFNHLLWDDWFVSSLSPKTEDFAVTDELDSNLLAFLTGEEIDGGLLNRDYRPSKIHTESEAAEKLNEYKNNSDSWEDFASEIVVEGMFNVNSTSVDAWAAILKAYKKIISVELTVDPGADSTSLLVGDQSNDLATVSRMTLNPDGVSGFSGDEVINNPQLWDDQSIETLAEYIVDEVKDRGPFLSLSEFINRRLENGTGENSGSNLALAGAVDSALIRLANDADSPYRGLIDSYSGPEYTAQAINGVHDAFPEAAEGHVLYGTSGWARQADILRPIAPILSVRDDTFTIRAYGDVTDRLGNVRAKAWCEAVVVRTADFVDTSNEATDDYPELSDLNKALGRKFKIVAFRWLSDNDI